MTIDYAVSFEFTQLQREGLLRNRRYAAAKIRKPTWSLVQVDQYHDLPLTAEHLNRRFDGLDIGFTLGRITRFGGQRTSHKYRTFTKIFAYFSFRDLSHNMGTASTYRHVIPKGNLLCQFCENNTYDAQPR